MQGGFSIREYTSRMRSVNVANCWPFDENLSEGIVKSLLPPLVVKRFTWWIDELQLLHSETAEFKISEKKTKKMLEKGGTSSRNVDMGAGEGAKIVKVESLKGKMKATKKRSIVEIFAVAPLVKRADEEEMEEDTYCNVGSRARKNKNRNKKIKNTDVILKKALRVVKKIKRKKAADQKRGGGDEIDIPDKNQPLKKPLRDYSFVDEDIKSLKNYKRKQENAVLLLERLAQLREEVMALQLRCMNWTEVNCFEHKLHAQEKATRNWSSSCSKELDSDIHDCVSNPRTKPRLQDVGPYKKLMACQTFKLIEENKRPKVPTRGILRNESEEFSLKQSKKCLVQKTIQLNAFSVKKANKHVTFWERDEILGLSRKPSEYAECLELQNDCSSGVGKDSTSTETSGRPDASTRVVDAEPASKEQLTAFGVDSTTSGKQNYEGEHSVRSGSSERSALYGVDQHSSDHDLKEASRNGTPLCFKDYLGTHNDASMSHLSNMKRTYKQTQASLENTAINCAHSIHFQTFPHLSPNELLQTFCSLPEGGQTGDVQGRSSDGINEEFVGLPLNSQGELIASNSSAKREVNQMMHSNVNSAHCVGLSPPDIAVSNSLGHHSECRNLDSRTSSRKQLNLFPVDRNIKESAMTVIPSRLGITDSQSEKENLDLDLPEINYHRTICRGHNQVQKGPENEKYQSTMRLMGKEFEVGGRGMWKDKQIVDELHFHDLPHFDCQTSSTYRSVFLTRTVHYAQEYYPSSSLCTYSEVYKNSKSLFSEPFTTELPKASPTHHELCTNTSPGSIQLKNKKNLHHSPISAIKCPFMHPDLDVHANSSWARRSSQVHQPFCFDISEKATLLSNSQSCTLGSNHPHPKHVTSHESNSSVTFQSEGFCMFCPLPSGSASQSIAPALSTPLPYYPGVLPVSPMQRKYGNQNKIKEHIKSRIGIRDLNICKKSKGQHFKPLKRPTLGFHEGLQWAVRNMEDAFGCSATKNSRFVMSVEYDETNKEGHTQKILPFVDSYTETARTCPVKLTAGSKHISKARQLKDQDISFSAANIRFRFS